MRALRLGFHHVRRRVVSGRYAEPSGIREKGYADAYKADKRPVTLIGINFSAKKRNIDEPLIENLLVKQPSLEEPIL